MWLLMIIAGIVYIAKVDCLVYYVFHPYYKLQQPKKFNFITWGEVIFSSTITWIQNFEHKNDNLYAVTISADVFGCFMHSLYIIKLLNSLHKLCFKIDVLQNLEVTIQKGDRSRIRKHDDRCFLHASSVHIQIFSFRWSCSHYVLYSDRQGIWRSSIKRGGMSCTSLKGWIVYWFVLNHLRTLVKVMFEMCLKKSFLSLKGEGWEWPTLIDNLLPLRTILAFLLQYQRSYVQSWLVSYLREACMMSSRLLYRHKSVWQQSS